MRAEKLWVFALGLTTLIAVLGVAEIPFILAFDVAVVVQQGLDGAGFESFNLANITSGSIGLALLFATQCFSGFEATAGVPPTRRAHEQAERAPVGPR